MLPHGPGARPVATTRPWGPRLAILCPQAPRNIRFERALLRAIKAYKLANGGVGPHVLDIGSGTGLLAMMAARGGARKVTSCEMVPVIAAVARQIVERNGYGDVVTIHNTRSDQLTEYSLGGEVPIPELIPRALRLCAPASLPPCTPLGPRPTRRAHASFPYQRADLLVSELIDDHVIGDGVLHSISDARRRLLTPEALIVPRGARMYAIPVSVRANGPAGIALDDMNIFRTDQLVLSHPYHSVKLQRMAEADYTILGEPLELFDFDWTVEEPGTLAKGRSRPPMPLSFSRAGVFNAIVLYFTLQACGMRTCTCMCMHICTTNAHTRWASKLWVLGVCLALPWSHEHGHLRVRMGMGMCTC